MPQLALEHRWRRALADADGSEPEPAVGLEQDAGGAEGLRRGAGETGQRLERIALAVELPAHPRDRGRDVAVAVQHPVDPVAHAHPDRDGEHHDGEAGAERGRAVAGERADEQRTRSRTP